MPITLDGSNGITTPTYGGADTSEYLVPVTQFKNRLINSGMQIDQRNAGASVTQTTSVVYTLDRWLCFGSAASKFTVQQNAGSVTPPAGFKNYLGVTSSSAYSVGASELFQIQQMIEGFNTADLDFGSANAKTVTLSFWVRSSLTGTFGGALANGAADRSYPFTYTISSANTWEYKTVTVAGDTSGTWVGATNGIGLRVIFSMGAGASASGTPNAWGGFFTAPTGATSVVGTNGATFYITGVQLEVGSTATSFDYRPYGTELALCQRYFYNTASSSSWSYVGSGVAWGATAGFVYVSYPVPMRTTPSQSTVGTINTTNVQLMSNGTTYGVSSVGGPAGEGSTTANRVDFTTSTSMTIGNAVLARFSTNVGLTYSAEL